ncbi:hypothetical protein ACKWTF_004380 [Chironomus riparius]
MDIQETQPSVNSANLEHQNQQQVNSFCQNLISNNQVHSVQVQQEGEYLNLNIKIKIDTAQIRHNNTIIQNSDNPGQNLRKDTPATSTKLADTSLNLNDSMSYERFKEQLNLQNQKSNKKTQLMINSTAETNPPKNTIRPQLQSGLKHNLKCSDNETAKMLVILDSGEQRLITFISPKEALTVQELLDQVGIKVDEDTQVECLENVGSEIDYIVKIGIFKEPNTKQLVESAENHVHQQEIIDTATKKPTSPKLIEHLLPTKFIDGYYAVCSACNFHGLDLAKCSQCYRIYDDKDNVFRILRMSKV